MSSLLVAVGLIGVIAGVVVYAWMLGRSAPGRRVEQMSAGGLSREQILVWLLGVMLVLSVSLVGLGVTPNGVTLLGSVVVAALASEVARWWHNRDLPQQPAGDDEP